MTESNTAGRAGRQQGQRCTTGLLCADSSQREAMRPSIPGLLSIIDSWLPNAPARSGSIGMPFSP